MPSSGNPGIFGRFTGNAGIAESGPFRYSRLSAIPAFTGDLPKSAETSEWSAFGISGKSARIAENAESTVFRGFWYQSAGIAKNAESTGFEAFR